MTLFRRTPLLRTNKLRVKTPIGRKKRLRPVNQKRRAERLAEAFGEQADRCRNSPCCVCTVLDVQQEGASDPHHIRSRGAGGSDEHCIPMCRTHHDAVHRQGRRTFWARVGLDPEHVAEQMRRAA